jgi:ABC-type polysaccharide/polyol phosphate transport system ATPase subunit
MASIIFDNVTLQYPIYNAKSMSLRNQLVRIGTGGRMQVEARNVINITALKNVSFTLNHGDAVGLVGHNGAGKTTMLRTMAGIYQPVEGRVISEGSLSTIIELGAGTDQELSGYENIERMGLLLGYTRERMKNILPDIEEFTGLGNFLSAPMRTYSSGMTMRLMFAVATSINPEILLIDEMFATGDSNFQIKAQKRMDTLIHEAKIFVFASHELVLIKRYCNRVFQLKHGDVHEISLKDLDKIVASNDLAAIQEKKIMHEPFRHRALAQIQKKNQKQQKQPRRH